MMSSTKARVRASGVPSYPHALRMSPCVCQAYPSKPMVQSPAVESTSRTIDPSGAVCRSTMAIGNNARRISGRGGARDAQPHEKYNPRRSPPAVGQLLLMMKLEAPEPDVQLDPAGEQEAVLEVPVPDDLDLR